MKKIFSPENIVALMFILPYFEVGSIIELLEITVNGWYIPAIIIIQCCLIISFFIINITSIGNNGLNISKDAFMIGTWVFLFFSYLLFNIVSHSINASSTSLFIWIITPLLLAFNVYFFIINYKLNVGRIIKMGITYYVCYLVLNIILNIFIYDYKLLEMDRLISPGGGPVILAYTTVLILLVFYKYKALFSPKMYFVFHVVLLLSIILTISRGAIWPLSIIILYRFIFSRNTYKKLFSLVILICALVIINPAKLVMQYLPRVLDFDLGVRGETLISSLEIMVHQNFFVLLNGFGLNGFFPYIKWLFINNESSSIFVDYNQFLFGMQNLLVQPHNTYMYLLMETGIIGITIFLCLLFTIFKRAFSGNGSKGIMWIFIGVFILLNCFDAILIIQPGSAFIWWFILLLLSLGIRDNFKVQI